MNFAMGRTIRAVIIASQLLEVHDALMKRLDHKLDCKACGTIYLDVPEDVRDDSPIHCSSCHAFLGTWGELQRDFYRQAGEGIFHLHDGQIDALSSTDFSSKPKGQHPSTTGPTQYAERESRGIAGDVDDQQ